MHIHVYSYYHVLHTTHLMIETIVLLKHLAIKAAYNN